MEKTKRLRCSSQSSLYTAAEEVKEWPRVRKQKHPSQRDISKYRVQDPSTSLVNESREEADADRNETSEKLPDSELLSVLQSTAARMFSHPGHPRPYCCLSSTALLALGNLHGLRMVSDHRFFILSKVFF
jgi:hypothetical protein